MMYEEMAIEKGCDEKSGGLGKGMEPDTDGGLSMLLTDDTFALNILTVESKSSDVS